MHDTHAIPILEIAEILAAGLMRVAARKSSEFSGDAADKAVDFEGLRSGAVADQVTENAK